MKRTAEKTLSIISAVFTAISIILSFIFLAFVKAFSTDATLQADFEKDLLDFDPTLTPYDVEIFFEYMDLAVGFGWFVIIGLIISFIVTIVGIVLIWNNKNPKLAGVMFIVGGLFAFFLSLTSILLYIAAILCFIRKPPLIEEPGPLSFTETNYDDSMRPL